MARVEVVTCDRCGTSVDSSHAGGFLTIRTERFSSPWFTLDFCGGCTDQVARELRRRNKTELKDDTLQDVPVDPEIEAMKQTALRGIDAYNEGAGPEKLAQYLRDVTSGARRTHA